MEYIRINKDNLAKEHICCAISNNDDIQVSAKKSWLKERLDEGLVFLKSTERGKCFIEYIPAEYAWVPIKADNYLYIDCLWVSGSFKGHGYSNDLLNACIEDGKKQKKLGLCILSSAKKRGFLADPKFLSHKGFGAADEADNGIQLWYLPFKKDAQKPAFKDCARKVRIKDKGIVVYYSHQCPFTAKYVPVIEKIAAEKGAAFKAIQFKDKKSAQNAPTAVTNYALFKDGVYITNEIQSDKKFLKLLGE